MKKKKQSIQAIEDAKKFIIKQSSRQLGCHDKLKRLSSEILPEHRKTGSTPEDGPELLTDLSRAFGVETGHILVESVKGSYKELAIELKQSIQDEYNCTTALEKALADLIVNSYIRKLSSSNKLENYGSDIGPAQMKNRHLLSTEIDRAHRQFLSGLETLKAIKSPQINVKLKTDTAFIAQNQHIGQEINALK